MRALELICPKCGAHTWGSVFEKGVLIRKHCHGYRGLKFCGFSWPPEDDQKYFFKITQATAAEIKAAGLGP